VGATTVDIHKELVQQAIKNHRQSYHELYKLYAKAMFNLCLRMLGKREDAEDMLQEVFAEAFARIKDFRFDSPFGYWLKQIAVNKCISVLRKKQINFSETEEVQDFENISQINDSVNEEALQLQVNEVKKAMMQLGDSSRTVFSLYLFEGYDHTEIADILNISESTSKTQYMRARQKVKQLLIQSGYERG
jgi:RNA polymerase sigma-70 factor (ECF subfamily)